MVERRSLVRGGIAAGLASLMTADVGAAPPDRDDEASATAIDRFREASEHQFEQVYTQKWKGVARVRQQQRTWLMSARKYPDFLEIGIDVWDNLYDWHVVYQQPLNVSRLADGRYAMLFSFTTLLLRPDQNPDFVGYAFDADSQGRPLR